jgi:hypothetical protein
MALYRGLDDGSNDLPWTLGNWSSEALGAGGGGAASGFGLSAVLHPGKTPNENGSTNDAVKTVFSFNLISDDYLLVGSLGIGIAG